jgi:hypothetical protein
MRALSRVPRFALAGLLLLAGCFHPQLEPGFTCGDSSTGPECPDGFFCARNFTCQRLDDDGNRPVIGDHYGLGLTYPGLVAARLGDGVVVAGWHHDPLFGEDAFRVWQFDKNGEPLPGESEFDLFEFKDVDRSSLRAAGSGGVAVIAGLRKQGAGSEPHLVYAWIMRGVPPDARQISGEHNVKLAVTSNENYACVVRGAAADAGRSLKVLCHNGTAATSEYERGIAPDNLLLSISAAISSEFDDVVVAAEIEPLAGRTENRVFVFCPSLTNVPATFTAQPGAAGSLRPQVFSSWTEGYTWVTWQDAAGFKGYRVKAPGCDLVDTVTALAENDQGGAADFSLAGRGESTKFAGAPAAWSIQTRIGGQGGTQTAWVAGWTEGSETGETALGVPHPYLLNPRTIVDGNNNLWFFVHASDADDCEGWVKLYDPKNPAPAPADRIIAVGADDMQVTADFAVAPRKGGGFFLVYRHWTDEKPGSIEEPVDGFLAPIGPDLNVVYP